MTSSVHYKMAYKVQLAPESEPLHLVDLGGIQGLKESSRFCLYEGKQPTLKKRKYMVSEAVSGRSAMRYVGQDFGEGALHTTPSGCRYLVGVRDKKKGTLTLHKADIFCVKPTFGDSLVEDPINDKEEPSFMQKVAMVTEAFGGEKKRRVAAAVQRNKLDAEALDSTLLSAVELAQENTQREDEDQLPSGSLLAPPCNRGAQHPEEVYCLEDVAPRRELDALQRLALTTLEGTQQDLQAYREDGRYPLYVLNQLGRLSGATGEDAVNRASQLLYLATLMCLYLQNARDLSKKGPDIPEHIPSGVREDVLSRFASQDQSGNQKKTKYMMSRRQKDKLLNYILILILFLEEFSLDYTSLAADLRITTTKITTHLRALGCTLRGASRSKVPPSASPSKQLALLSLPLNFPVARGKRPNSARK